MHPPHASTARENGGYHRRTAQRHHQGTGSIRSATRHRHSHSRLLPHQHQRPLCRCAIRIKLKFNNTNYNSHEAGASAYLQAPYYEKLTAVVVYEVVGSVTIPYACVNASIYIVGTVIGPLVSASYSLRILYHAGPTFTHHAARFHPAVTLS